MLAPSAGVRAPLGGLSPRERWGLGRRSRSRAASRLQLGVLRPPACGTARQGARDVEKPYRHRGNRPDQLLLDMTPQL